MPPKKTDTSSHYKKGPLSKEERKNIEDWVSTMDSIDIAKRLNRPLKIVDRYKQEFLAKAPRLIAKRSETEELMRELHSSGDWPLIKQQFTHLELVFYENKYVEYRRHFKEMTAMELSQLHQLITLDIKMQRHNIETRQVQESSERLNKEYNKLSNRDYASLDDDEKEQLTKIQGELTALKAASKNKTDEYNSLLGKHTDLLKSLKSTRDQRIKNNDNDGKFIGILYELEIQSRRNEMSFENAVHEMAKQKELERLSQIHRFGDGMLDQAILNHEVNNPEFD